MKIDRGWVLRAGISLLALGGLGYFLRDKLEAALLILRHGFQWEWFLAAIGAYGLAIVITSRRLQMIFHVQKVKVSFLQTVHLSFLGLFFTLFLPSALGGDIAKGYFAYQYSGKKLGSFTGVVLDRMVGFISLFPIVLTALAVALLTAPFTERPWPLRRWSVRCMGPWALFSLRVYSLAAGGLRRNLEFYHS